MARELVALSLCWVVLAACAAAREVCIDVPFFNLGGPPSANGAKGGLDSMTSSSSWRPNVEFVVIGSPNVDLRLGTDQAGGDPNVCRNPQLTHEGVLSAAGCGSTPLLVRKALEEMALEDPDALIIIGSLSAPRPASSNVSATTTISELDACVSQIAATNGTAFETVIVSPGKNDLPGIPPGTFNIDAASPSASDAAALERLESGIASVLPWSPGTSPPLEGSKQTPQMIGAGIGSNQEAFRKFGAYQVNVSNGAPVSIISLNTLLMLEGLQPFNADFYARRGVPSLMDEQLDWLDDQIEAAVAARKYVVIVGEESIGVDVGPAGKDGLLQRSLWSDAATAGFRRILDKYCKTIVALIFAEQFSAQIRIVSGATCDTPMMNVAGLAPIELNNPTVTRVTLGLCEQHVTSWTQRSIPLLQNATAARVGYVAPGPTAAPTEAPRTQAPGSTTTPQPPGPALPTIAPAPPPIFTSTQDVTTQYGGATVSIVTSTLTTLLERTKPVAFAEFQAASAGSAPERHWSFAQQRAILCAQLHSDLPSYSSCAAMCDPIAASWTMDSWAGFPPQAQFAVGPYVMLSAIVGTLGLLYMLPAALVQRRRFQDLVRTAALIADAAPAASAVAVDAWERAHGHALGGGTSPQQSPSPAGTPPPEVPASATDPGASTLPPAGLTSGDRQDTAASTSFSAASHGITTFLLIDPVSNTLQYSDAPPGTSAADAAREASTAPGAGEGTSAAGVPASGESFVAVPKYFRMDTRDARTGERTNALIEWDASLEAFHSRAAWFRRSAFHRWVRWASLPGPPGCDTDLLLRLVTQVAQARVQLHRAASAYLDEKAFYDDGLGDTRVAATMELLKADLAIQERGYVVLLQSLASATTRLLQHEDSCLSQHDGQSVDDDETRPLRPPQEDDGDDAGSSAAFGRKKCPTGSRMLAIVSRCTWRLRGPKYRLRALHVSTLHPPPVDLQPDDARYDTAATNLLHGVRGEPGYVTGSPILTLCDVMSIQAANKKGRTVAVPTSSPTENAAAAVAGSSDGGSNGSGSSRGGSRQTTPPSAAATTGQQITTGLSNWYAFVGDMLHVRDAVSSLRDTVVSQADAEYSLRPSAVVKEWREAVLRLATESTARPLPGRRSMRGGCFNPDQPVDSIGSLSYAPCTGVDNVPTAGLDAGVPWLWRELRCLARYHVLYWHQQRDATKAHSLSIFRVVDPPATPIGVTPSYRAALLPPSVSFYRVLVFSRVLLGLAVVIYSQEVLYRGLPHCDSHSLSAYGEASLCAVFCIAAAASSKPFGFSVVTFTSMWTSITALASPRQADNVALTLLAIRAAIDMFVFLAVWAPSDRRPAVPHPHVTGCSEGAGAIAAWQAAIHTPHEMRSRVLVGPRSRPVSAVDPVSPSAALLVASSDNPAFRPILFDWLNSLRRSENSGYLQMPFRIHWMWAPDMICGPNLIATIDMLGTCCVSVFNSLAVLFLSSALSNLLNTVVDVLSGDALPAERLALTTQTVFFVAVSIGSLVGQYAVSVAVAGKPSRDGTISLGSDGMPLPDRSRGWINTVFPTSLAFAVFVVMVKAGLYLALCAVAFIVFVTGMQVMLAIANNRPQAPWWAAQLVGSTRIYAPIAFTQATNALNVFAMASITLVLVGRASGSAPTTSSSGINNNTDALRLTILLRAFGPAVSMGLAPNLVVVFIWVRNRVLKMKHRHVHRLRMRLQAQEQWDTFVDVKQEDLVVNEVPVGKRRPSQSPGDPDGAPHGGAPTSELRRLRM